MLNGYTGTLVLALHLLPVVPLWATWKLPQEAAGSKIVLGQTLGSGVFLLLFPMAEQLHWGWGLSALRLDLSLLGGEGCVIALYLITAGAVALGAVQLRGRWNKA